MALVFFCALEYLSFLSFFLIFSTGKKGDRNVWTTPSQQSQQFHCCKAFAFVSFGVWKSRSFIRIEISLFRLCPVEETSVVCLLSSFSFFFLSFSQDIELLLLELFPNLHPSSFLEFLLKPDANKDSCIKCHGNLITRQMAVSVAIFGAMLEEI